MAEQKFRLPDGTIVRALPGGGYEEVVESQAAPAVTGIGVDPYKAREVARNEANDARDAEKEARVQAREDARELRDQIEWKAKFNPDGTPKAGTLNEGQQKAKDNADAKLKAADAISRQLGQMREIYERSFKGSGPVQSTWEMMPTADAERFKAIARSMRADLKPLIRGPNEGTFTEGDQALLDDLIPDPKNFDAYNEQTFEELESRVKGVQQQYGKQGVGLTANKPADQKTEVAGGATKTEFTQTDLDKKIAAMLARGRPASEIKKVAGGQYPKLDSILAWRSMHPEYKGTYDVSTKKVVPTTITNRIMASPLATVATQAANALSAGTLDEIGGAARSLVTGEPLADTIASANINKQMQAAANPRSALAGNVLGGAGAVLSGGAALRGLGIGRGAWATANPIKASIAGDAAYGTAYGGGESNDSRLTGAALGLGAGAFGSGVGSGVARVAGGAMRGVTNEAAERLRALGIPLTGAEVLGGGWKKVQDAMTSIPVVGSMVSRRNEEGRRSFNEAAFNTAAKIVGPPINAVGQDGITLLNQAKSQAYSNALDPVSVNLNDPDFSSDIMTLGDKIAAIPNDDGARSAAFNALQYRLGNNTNPGGDMTGRNFQEAYRGLGRAPAERGPKAYAHEFAEVTRGGQDALAGVLERQAPGAYEGFLKANKANRHLAVLVDAVNAAKSQISEGEALFTPGQLGTASTNNTKKFGGKIAAAMGDRPFDQLTTDAQQVMGQQVPDSGTAARAMVGLGLTSLGGGGIGYGADGGGSAAAGAVAPAALLTLLGTRRGQQALVRGLMDRPGAIRGLGNNLVTYAPVGGSLLAAPSVGYVTGQ